MKICCHSIEFSYNGIPVLENITFTFDAGDFVALVGPNGSGKSTFIKCLNRILKVQNGVVLVNNRDIRHFSMLELAQNMAYVPQLENRNSSLKVFDVVMLGRKPYVNWKPSEDDIHTTSRIVKSLHLDAIAMRDFSKLSGGQQQIVLIARALAQEPKILLLDEPTANLDMKHHAEIMNILNNLALQGITVITAIHDINSAVRYANKIIMLKEGKIFAAGGKDIVNEENIEKLYDIPVRIFYDNGNSFVVPDVFSSNKNV